MFLKKCCPCRAPAEYWTDNGNGTYSTTFTADRLGVSADDNKTATFTYTYTVQPEDAGKTITNSAVGPDSNTTGDTTKTDVEGYALTYDANGGTGAPTDSHEYDAGDQATVSSTVPTRDGFQFMGWATEATATVAQYQAGDSITMNQNITLYAVWQVVVVDSYTLTYNANGGSGTMPDDTAAFGASYTLPPCDFTPPQGKQFQAWATSTDGTTVYQPGARSEKSNWA